MNNSQILFTPTLGAGPESSSNLRFIDAKVGYQNFDVGTNNLSEIINTLIEINLDRVNVMTDNVCLGHITINTLGNGSRFGEANMVNGRTFFIKGEIAEADVLKTPGMNYYPFFKELIPEEGENGLVIHIFNSSDAKLFPLSLKGMKDQACTFRIHEDSFNQPLFKEEFTLAHAGLNSMTLSYKDVRLFNVAVESKPGYLHLTTTLGDLAKEEVLKVLDALGFTAETSVKYVFSHFSKDDTSNKTFGDYLKRLESI